MEPPGVQRHNVPHFKGLIMLYLDIEAQGRGSTFTLCHALLKKAILEGKTCNGRFILQETVHMSLIMQQLGLGQYRDSPTKSCANSYVDN